MKVLIEIPEKVYKKAVDGMLNEIDSCYLNGAVVNGTSLPKDATNGDVIKVAFPNIPLDSDDYFVRDMYDNIRCWKEWWNAPYKAEREVKE